MRSTPIGTIPTTYLLKRSERRRSVALQVDERGLVVMAPMRSSDRHIEQVLEQHAAWVHRKLAAWRRNAPPSREWQSGARVEYLGQQLTLQVLHYDGRPSVMLLDDHQLEIRIADPQHSAAVRTTLARWYKRHAQGHFATRVEHYAHALNLRKMPRMMVSNATSRWGSCNARREIRLSWRLMQAHPSVIDYVVAHEVAHILEMNHSPRFWDVVERLCPEYAKHRSELNAMTRHYMSL